MRTRLRSIECMWGRPWKALRQERLSIAALVQGLAVPDSQLLGAHTQRLLRRPVDRLKNCTRRQDGVESGNDPRRPCSTSEQALSGEVESRSQFSEILEVSHRSTEPCTHASKIADGRNQIRASPWRTGLFLPRTLYRNVLLQDGIRRS